MSKTVQNIIFNVTYQIFNIIIPLITAPYIARVMGASVVGVYSYSSTMASYFSVFMLLGVANYGSRTIAISQKDRTKKFWEIYFFQFFMSVVGNLIFMFLALRDGEYKSALVAQVFYLLSVLMDVSWYFAGTGQFKTTLIRGLSIKVLQTILIFCFVKNGNDIILYILIMSIGNLVGSFVLWPILIKQIGYSKVHIGGVVSHIKPNLILFLPLLASSIFVYMDKIMLTFITDDISHLGWYEYAEKIVRIPLTIISAIGAVMMPKIASISNGNHASRIHTYMNISMRYISILATAMCFGLVGIASDLVPIYLGGDFLPSVRLVQIMSTIIIFSSFANIIRTQYLIPLKKEKGYVISIFAGAFVNIVLNMIFIPVCGAMGAALGTVGAEITVFVGHIFAVNKHIRIWGYLKEWGYSILNGIVMFVVIQGIGLWFDNDLLRLILKFILGTIVYAITTLVLLILRKDNYIVGIVNKNSIRDIK